MNHSLPARGSSYLVWPLAVLFFLTIGVFLTTKEVPKTQDTQSRAQIPLDASSSASQVEEVTPTDIPPEESSPAGAVLSFSFSLPGIASQAGNIRPIHATRNAILSFYDKDVNIADVSVKPLYQLHTQALFDANPASPTYAYFVQDGIDLGEDLPNGEYQIALKVDQALQKVIKKRESDIGGEIFIITNQSTFYLSFQGLLVGDIIPSPSGDNSIDIADYNAFIDCFGNKQNSSDCVAKQGADFDDNGVVDGIDYNIMLRNFQSLLSLGFSVPTLLPTKPATAHISPSIAVKPTVAPKQVKSSLNPLGIIFTIIVLIWVVFLIRFLIKKKKGAIKKENPPASAGIEDKEYYLKKQTEDPSKKGTWVTLTDDSGPHLGFYAGTDVKEGFVHIKGAMKKENDKTFIAITKIISDEK